MIIFPPAKINLGLYVTSKRSDGYHDIETVFYPIGLTDILEVVPDQPGLSGETAIRFSGLPVAGEPSANLVIKAYEKIHSQRALPPVKIWLHKAIPSGAGLGGGSSDGSAMLLTLNRLFDLRLDDALLREMALELGSDCPFFLDPRASLARGRGEQLRPVGLDLGGLFLYLFHPGIMISTSEAYRQIRINRPADSLDRLISKPVASWRGSITNSFEPYAINRHPVIGKILEFLRNQGALFSSLTGSGSAVFGLFDRKIGIPGHISEYLIWNEQLSS